MPDADQSTYRLFNQALYLSSAIAAFAYAGAAARCSERTTSGIALFGYAALSAGLAATGMQLGTHAEPLTICAGIG